MFTLKEKVFIMNCYFTKISVVEYDSTNPIMNIDTIFTPDERDCLVVLEDDKPIAFINCELTDRCDKMLIKTFEVFEKRKGNSTKIISDLGNVLLEIRGTCAKDVVPYWKKMGAIISEPVNDMYPFLITF